MAQKDDNRTVNIGVIGGGFGRVHILGYQYCDDARVTALCQRTRASAETIAREYGIPRVYSDYRDLLEVKGLDAVSIAAPPYLHLPMTLEALNRGLHVLCEKPLAMNRDEAAAMLARARETNRAHMTAFNFRFIPAVMRMKELLDEGYPGRIFHVGASWFAEQRADPTWAFGWRHRRELAAVGALGDAGVHLIDWVRWLIGDFKKVSGHSAVFIPERMNPDGPGKGTVTVEDACAFVAELAGGVQAAIQVSGAARYGNCQTVEVFGSDGMLRLRIDRRAPRWFLGDLSGARGNDKEARPLPLPDRLTRGMDDSNRAPRGLIFANLVRAFIQAIRTGNGAIPDFHDGFEAQKVLDAVSRSAREERWVSVDP